MQQRSWLSTLNEVFQATASLVLAGSAVFAVYQYFQSRADTRVVRTLEFTQRFEGPAYASSRSAVTQIAVTARNALTGAFADNRLRTLSSAEVADLRRRLLLSVVYDNASEIPPALSDITGFFSSLQACIDQHVCDANTAHAFLGSYARSFWQDFKVVVQYERAHSRRNFASGMEKYLKWRARSS